MLTGPLRSDTLVHRRTVVVVVFSLLYLEMLMCGGLRPIGQKFNSTVTPPSAGEGLNCMTHSIQYVIYVRDH